MPYFAERQDSLFIISSDFCHWGYDFDYTPYENLNAGKKRKKKASPEVDVAMKDEEGSDSEMEWTPIWEFI